jgi:hypothetical protein
LHKGIEAVSSERLGNSELGEAEMQDRGGVVNAGSSMTKVPSEFVASISETARPRDDEEPMQMAGCVSLPSVPCGCLDRNDLTNGESVVVRIFRDEDRRISAAISLEEIEDKNPPTGSMTAKELSPSDFMRARASMMVLSPEIAPAGL